MRLYEVKVAMIYKFTSIIWGVFLIYLMGSCSTKNKVNRKYKTRYIFDKTHQIIDKTDTVEINLCNYPDSIIVIKKP